MWPERLTPPFKITCHSTSYRMCIDVYSPTPCSTNVPTPFPHCFGVILGVAFLFLNVLINKMGAIHQSHLPVWLHPYVCFIILTGFCLRVSTLPYLDESNMIYRIVNICSKDPMHF